MASTSPISRAESQSMAQTVNVESPAAQIAISVSMGAWQVSRFFKALKNVDQTINGFTTEIESLAIACEAVGVVMEEQINQQDSQSERFWACLETRLRACNTTISQLELAVDSVKQGVKKDKSPFAHMVRQMCSKGKSKEVDMVKNEIRTHATCIQLIVHVCRIKISYLASGSVDTQLCTELAQLKERKQELIRLRAQVNPKRMRTLDINEAELISISDAVVFSGETLYASGVSRPPTTGLSVYGEQSSDRAKYTRSWVGNIPCNPSTPETDTPSVFSQPRAASISTPLTPQTDTLSVFSRPQEVRTSLIEDTTFDKASTAQYSTASGYDVTLESDDEIDIETVQRAIESGRTLFERQDFVEANLRLSEALKMVHELPPARQDVFDTCQLQYMISLYAFHHEDPSSALPTLLNVLESNPKDSLRTEKNRLQILEVNHLLATTYMRLNELEKARTSCQEALKGRRRLLGKRHDAYYESLELMAAIWDAEGNTVRAQIYRDIASDECGGPLIGHSSSLSAPSPRHESLSTGSSEAQLIPPPSENRGDSFKTVLPTLVSGSGTNVAPLTVAFPDASESTSNNALKQIPPLSATIVDVSYGPFDDYCTKSSSTAYPYPFMFPSGGTPASPDAGNRSNQPKELATGNHSSSPPIRTSHTTLPAYEYRDAGLRRLAESTQYRKPGPADYNLRQVWRIFFNITPKTELSFALLENRKQDALYLIPEGQQKKTRIWSRKSRSNSSIDRRDVLLAALFGDDDVFEKLARSGADIDYNKDDLNGLTPLHCAALGGSCSIAARLIAAHSPADLVWEKYGTPLALAVLGERIDLVDLLLRHTTSLYRRCGNLGSVIHAACATGNASLVGALSGGRQEESGIVLPLVIRKLRSILVSQTLLDPPSEALLVHNSTERLELLEGRPLAVASYMGCRDVVEYLLSQPNVDINAICGAWSPPNTNMETPLGSNQHTALTVAAGSGQDDIVRMLLQKGTTILPRKGEREDALLLAILNDRTTCALLLVEYGAPVSSLCFKEATNRSMLPLVAKMRARRGGVQSSIQSAYSHDKSGVAASMGSIGESM